MMNERHAKIEVEPTDVVAEICLYGPHCGAAGWYAQTRCGQRLGVGGYKEGVTRSMCIDFACGVLQHLGYLDGRVVIYDSDGKRCATTSVAIPETYGSLSWTPAKPIEIRIIDPSQN
jgi:hypothetical protein